MSSLFPLVLAAVLGLIPARIAAAKGRSFGLWWLYGWLFLIIALPHALLLRPRPAVGQTGGPPLIGHYEPGRVEPDLVSGARPGPPLHACPSCGEQVRVDTGLCPFCGAVGSTR